MTISMLILLEPEQVGLVADLLVKEITTLEATDSITQEEEHELMSGSLFREVANKQDLAESMGLKSFDTALPQDWVDEAFDLGLDPRPSVVWSYDHHMVFGQPVGVDAIGKIIVAAMELNNSLTTAPEVKDRVTKHLLEAIEEIKEEM